jgi:L-rhamnose-H+ transport protein
MMPNPALGVVFHWLGGLASGSFYVPFRGVKRWSWETYWLVGGIFSWIVAPWIVALLLTKHLPSVLAATPASTLFWCFFFGLLWGVGGLTFGLTMRYLGLSLGMAIVMGLCATFGTLMPPLFKGELVSLVFGTVSGRVILLGIAVCLAGIAMAGLAGIYKERAMPREAQQKAIAEFDLKKGLMVAIVCGIMSACFAYGLSAGDPIRDLTVRSGTPQLWQGLPVLVVILLGGFTTNFIWTVILNLRNQTGHEYVAARAPLLSNYLFCALAGVTWYMQFFFYTMGETQMGRYKFSSWTIHMGSIIIFGTLWGIGFHEWRGAGVRAFRLLLAGLAVLIGSTILIGYGNYLGTVADGRVAGALR